MHEQSETVERDGRFYNVYGKTLPQAGKVLPGEPEKGYDTLDSAVTAAQQRSAAYGRDHDLSSDYSAQSAERGNNVSVKQMEDWLATMQTGGAQPAAVPDPLDPGAQRRQGGRVPARRPGTGPLGGPEVEQSTAGKIVGNIGEAVPSAIQGVNEAVVNATPFLVPLADWLDNNVADTRIKYDPPGTTTGNIVKGASQFMTGFIPLMRSMKTLGATGTIGPAMTSGAIADFVTRSGAEGRLSDWWVKAGLQKNILTDYLSSKEGDTEVEGRFKNAVEGLGLGVMSEGVFLGARALRAMRGVSKAAIEEQALLEAKYGKLSDEDFNRLIGDPSKPTIETRVHRPPEAGKKIVQAAEDTNKFSPRSVIRMRRKGADGVKEEDFDVFVNFNRIEEPDQVKFTIGKMAEAMKSQVDEARRGVITQAETAKLADDLGMTVPDLLSRRKGQPLNAEEALAARNLWAASGTRLLELAKKAASPNAGALDQYEFRKAMAVHAAIQSEVIGARTETARALASWRIEAKGRTEQLRAIDQTMTAMGGPEASKEIARRLAILAEHGDPRAIGKFVERGWGAISADAIKEAWVNGLLANPMTHAVNTSSNLLVAFQQIYERAAAMGIRQFKGGEGVAPGEATAMAYGMVESLKDAFKLAAKALKTGETSLGFNKTDIRPNAISPEAFRMSRETGAGRAVDFIGTAVRMPSRLLQSEDEFFKTIGYRMELRAQALRTASQEGHSGEGLAKRIEEIMQNPPEHIRINAADAAMYSTFTGEMGSFGKAMMKLRDIDHPLNPMVFVLPFVRTPVNIARYAFERTPFAPLVSQWRADIAAGGARADLALARMSTGTAIMTVAMDLADSGMITGAGPKNEDKDVAEALQRQNIPPYSFKVGDRWYSYNRADPLGMTLGFAASIAEAVRKGEIDEDDVDEWNEVAAMSIAAVSQVTINKTYLEGFAKFVEVMTDPKRHTQQYVDDLVASFVPFTGLMSSIKNVNDPVQREVNSPADAVMARIATLSDKLPPRRDLWGRPLTRESGLGKMYDFIVPFASRQQVDSPIDRELVRLNSGPLRITKKTSFDGVRTNLKMWPDVYDTYVRLAGNDLKHPAFGLGAMDFLNQVVSGKHALSPAYKVLSDEGRKDFINNTIREYRGLAQQQILNDPKYRAFMMEHELLRQEQSQAQMPVLGEQK